MKKMSLQWRLTCITTLCIAIICGCLTMFVYKNGVYYMDFTAAYNERIFGTPCNNCSHSGL